jgi:hypothetical protein
MNSEDIKEILRRVDEFNAIEVKDVIQVDDEETLVIVHTALTIATKEKLISFMKDDELISLDRDAYVLGNWQVVGRQIELMSIDSKGCPIVVDTCIL